MGALFRNLQVGLHCNKRSQSEFREEASGVSGVQAERSNFPGTDATCDGGRCSQPQEKLKRAAAGPLPGVTQDIAGFKIAHKPSIYVLDSPGVLVPSISDIKTGLKLALAVMIYSHLCGIDFEVVVDVFK
ncbi:hypothetical protein VIGAN_06084600 [Vigna angularis var. angularis]|uniref:G domain-containing protein n=1 Tax=Vigna angularis var. angularis TaxID=157739 RepID=A0A0S3SAJ8_PHAAN|nr:hypothetical protein VIGAN_06084600 [Vigna angularis var. angularis]